MPKPIPLALRDELRLLYENSPLSIAQMCAQTGVSTGRLYRMIKKHNWTRRKKEEDNQSAPNEETNTVKDARTRHMTFNRLRNLIERELDLLAQVQEGGSKREPLTADQAARTFASLVKTLGELKKLQEETSQTGQSDAPEDIETVRRDLAQRLDRLRAAAGENH